jgi:hypothetical protein
MGLSSWHGSEIVARNLVMTRSAALRLAGSSAIRDSRPNCAATAPSAARPSGRRARLIHSFKRSVARNCLLGISH